MTTDSRMSRLTVGLAAAAVVLPLAPVAASAAAFSVSPVRIYMHARERATAITVVNESDTELVMEAELFQWAQKPDGTDELVPTDDLILAPPLLKMAPKSRQVLRLANLKPVPPGEQLTYRMIVREVPEAAQAAEGVQVQVTLAFSLPVFITPAGAKQRLFCDAKPADAETIVASCENQGGAYAQPVNFSFRGPSGDVLLSQDVIGGYILPKIRRDFQLKRPAAGPALRGPMRLAVTQDDGSVQSFDVMLGN
ncbi:molecular chaperone [Ramlibacter lithotrophicus]|nr:fimbria/pilus periplasmic chaperone [Ramlibacter lithotrophicus]